MPETELETQAAVETPSPSTESGRDNATGATETSPNSPGAKGTDSPTAQATKPPTFAETLGKARDILGEGLPEQGAEEAAETATAAKPEPTQAKPGEAAKADEQAAKPGEAETGPDAPFHKRPEWAELTTALGEDGAKKARPILRKLMERETALSTQIEQSRPEVEAAKELKTLAGDEKGFEFMRGVVRMFAAGDPKGIPIMEVMLNQMRERNGLVVQSADVKTRLDKGEIDEAAALEIEKARASQRRTQAQLDAQREREKQGQVEAASTANQKALDEWESSIRTKDVDFGNVTEPDDSQHGISKADQVMTELTASLQARPPKTHQDLVAAAQKAYDTVNRRLATYLPKPRAIKAPITSDTSSRTAKVKPKGFKETADAATSILFGSAT
jgi:hypothetical protein